MQKEKVDLLRRFIPFLLVVSAIIFYAWVNHEEKDATTPVTVAASAPQTQVGERGLTESAREYNHVVLVVRGEPGCVRIVSEAHLGELHIMTFQKTDGTFVVAVFKGRQRIQ